MGRRLEMTSTGSMRFGNCSVIILGSKYVIRHILYMWWANNTIACKKKLKANGNHCTAVEFVLFRHDR